MLELLKPAARRISEIGIPAAAEVEVEIALTEYALIVSVTPAFVNTFLIHRDKVSHETF